eukprot:m.247742 g.247742  ORF g.247742 m.247742 type:complete len:260 (-) comp22602_c2_seq5:17-796(-)
MQSTMLLLCVLPALVQAATMSVEVRSGRVPDRDSWPRGDSDAHIEGRYRNPDSRTISTPEDPNNNNPVLNYNFGTITGTSATTFSYEVIDCDSFITACPSSDSLGRGSFNIRDQTGCGSSGYCSVSNRDVSLSCGSGCSFTWRIDYADVDACATNNGGCGPNASCRRDGDNIRTCICNTNYEMVGSTCTRINPCNTNNGGCGSNSQCTFPSYQLTCTCQSGYRSTTNNGKNCVSINPCADTPSICGENSNVGTFHCPHF